MNILITGLTLHNNKGGPALALSLMNLLNTRISQAHFYMSVPTFGNNLDLEKKWANEYGLVREVIGRVSAKHFVAPFIKKYSKQLNDYLDYLKTMDLIIDLTALSYMDIEKISFIRNLERTLSNFSTFYFCNKVNKPFVRWTQSYGPFSNFFTKYITKQDLNRQKYLFSRGKQSSTHLRSLLPNKIIYTFPDIAISLPKKEDYIIKYLRNNNINSDFITISPSSVLYNIQGKEHIYNISCLISFLAEKGYKILLVPHNRMSIHPSLYNCDLEICKAIQMQNLNQSVYLIEDDLNVLQLKGIISKSIMHIGSRYHSVVAALSSGVPTISLGWHDKYKDIMQMYGLNNFVLNDNESIGNVYNMISKIEQEKEDIKAQLIKFQQKLNLKIEENLELFLSVIKDLNL